MALFTKLDPNTCVCFTWFERDRQNVRLETPNGRVIFDLWDEDVTHAIEDGYLPTPRRPRPRDADWKECALSYAWAKGLL